MGDLFRPVAFLGAGAFAEMIMKGALHQRFFRPEEVIATVRQPDRAEALHRKYAIRVESDNAAATDYCRTLVVCVRPGQFEDFFDTIASVDFKDKLIVSVMAGVPSRQLCRAFNSKRVVRANPNPQVETGYGYTAISASSGVGTEDKAFLENLFAILGDVDWVDELALDAVSALSGIAHVLYFYEALVDAGIYLGLSSEIAGKIARRSIMGAMVLLERRQETAVRLIREATTPGGVGVEKLFELERCGFRTSVLQAMRAARDKAAKSGMLPDETFSKG